MDAAREGPDRVTDESASDWVAPFDDAALAREAAFALHDLGMPSEAAAEAERAVAMRGGCRDAAD